MTQLEQQVQHVLDDEALSEDAREAVIKRLMTKYGREPVANAVKCFVQQKLVWYQSLLNNLNALGELTDDDKRQQ
jgi:hypothetical protein